MIHSPLTEGDYAALRGDVARVVERICPGWLASRRDDLVQAVVMRVMEIQRRSEGGAVLSTFYLRKAAHSALVDEIRRQRRRQEVPMEGDADVAEPATPLPDPERQAAARQSGRAIRACLAALVRPRRLAVVLHLQGHTVPELSALLRWSLKRGENLVYRGMADLRRCLARRGATP